MREYVSLKKPAKPKTVSKWDKVSLSVECVCVCVGGRLQSGDKTNRVWLGGVGKGAVFWDRKRGNLSSLPDAL